ncbi:hypothetical protein M8C21_017071, partial [Ambrosia artemisiifolia]
VDVSIEDGLIRDNISFAPTGGGWHGLVAKGSGYYYGLCTTNLESQNRSHGVQLELIIWLSQRMIPFIVVVVSSHDWPEVTKYEGLVSAQSHKQELIQELYKTWHDEILHYLGLVHVGHLVGCS